MRSLIVSDIHGNLPALEAVVADAAGGYDQVACLGDIVGYGADPNDVTRWVRESAAAVIRGNHDKACTGDPSVEDFSEMAQQAALWTREHLNDESFQYLRTLPEGPLPVGDFFISHGSPRDEDEYVFHKEEAADLFRLLPGTLCFFGHTHIQGGFALRKGRTWIFPRTEACEREMVLQLEPDTWYLLNPGSVGQPRDGDPRAAYAIYDDHQRTVAYRRVPYDVKAAQGRILSAGLPLFLAARLGLGR